MPARQCSLSRESSVVLCLVRKKADVDACFEYAFSSGEPVLAGGGRDAGVDSSGSFSFPMLLLSMMAELGPSTIGTGTNNIGTNVDAWDRFSFLIMSLALLRTSGRLCLVAH